MANLKISQLPEYTGNTSGSYLVMNNSGETTTYKVKKENYIFPYNGDATISGSLTVSGSLHKFIGNTSLTGSLDVRGSVNKFQGDVEITGSIVGVGSRALAVSGSVYVARTLFVGNSSVQPTGGIIIAQADNPEIYASGSRQSTIYAQALPTGSTGTTVNIGMYASGSNSVSLFTNTGTFLQIMSGSVSEPIQLLRTTNITGSVNISTVMTLAQQSPLPSATTGSLAVSGSNLFYHNGSSWSQIN
jgi:hypothetical protein